MTRFQKNLTTVIAAVVLGLTLALVGASGLGPALIAHFQAPAGGAVTESGMAGGGSTAGDVGRAQAAVVPPDQAGAVEEPTISLEERRARWYAQFYEGRTFEVSETPARHPEP